LITIFRLDDPTAVANVQSFLDGQIKYEFLHSRIGFSLQISSESCKVVLVITYSWLNYM